MTSKSQENKEANTALLIIRHGERIDFTFNPPQSPSDRPEHWIKKAYDKEGTYQRFNLNMPRTLPDRPDGYNGYYMDPPLTEIGYLQAKLTGKALKEASVPVASIHCSPAYRCLQTAMGIIKGMNRLDLDISIEPGLFEWGGWFKPEFPYWLPKDYLINQLHFNIDSYYIPVYPRDKMKTSESIRDYYERSYRVTKSVGEKIKGQDGGTAILVGHGASLDTCSRQICGGAARKDHDFYNILHQTPFLAVACLRPKPREEDWELIQPPIPPLHHQNNHGYDWKLLKNEISAYRSY